MKHATLQAERLCRLEEYIREKGVVSTDELCAEFGVSKATARRDIDSLAERNLVKKTHGGALSPERSLGYEIPYRNKLNLNQEKKKQLARLAVNEIENNDVIFLDSGTTCYEIANLLVSEPKEGITVITHDIRTALRIAEAGTIKLVCAGGTLMKGVYSLTGQQTQEMYARLHANKAFLGIDALHPEFGISNPREEEVLVKQNMLRNADRNYLIFDSSKYGTKSLIQVLAPADFGIISTVITDCTESCCRNLFETFGTRMLVDTGEAEEE